MNHREKWLVTSVSWMTATIVLFGSGCIPLGDNADELVVRGRLVDAETGLSVTGAFVGGRTITGGEQTDFYPPDFLTSDADGTFGLRFHGPLGPSYSTPPFPTPDQVEILVVRDECLQQFMIEINEDTAEFFDREFPEDDELELTDPILVPPCEESP